MAELLQLLQAAKALDAQQQQTRQTESLAYLSTRVNSHADLLNNHATTINELIAIVQQDTSTAAAMRLDVESAVRLQTIGFFVLIVLIVALGTAGIVWIDRLRKRIGVLESLKRSVSLPAE